MSRFLAACVGLALLAETNDAFAEEPDRVEWNASWPRFRLVEGIDTVVLGVAAIGVSFGIEAPDTPHWRGGILFDDAVRSALRGRSYGAQSTATTIGNVFFIGGVFVPLVIDTTLALVVHNDGDVAIQMLLIDAQSLAIAGFISVTAEHTVGRARPYTADCGPNGAVLDASGRPLLNSCGGHRDNESFFSGHTAAVATMAGLTCAHHQHLPLYGGGVADVAPCAVMIGATLTTGVARMVGDHHYASDVLLGLAVGALSGYVLPSVLHYGFGSGEPVGEARIGNARLIPVPQAYADGAGVGVVGAF
jgi:membrane-associated phospholipid phosphatase